MKFPFAAVLGAEDMACILSLIDISPETDGVPAQGEKGTMEFTMVRTLADMVHSNLQVEGVA